MAGAGRPPAGGPGPAGRGAQSVAVLGKPSHAHPDALDDLEDGCKRADGRAAALSGPRGRRRGLAGGSGGAGAGALT